MFHQRASEIPALASADGSTSFVAAQQNENIHVGGGGGGGGNGTSGGTGKGVSFQTPSNVKKSLTTGGTKTSNNNGGGGTATIRRRALGDISNKKSNAVHTSQQRKVSGQSALKPKSGLSSRTNGTTLIPTLSSKKTSSSSTSIIPASSLSVKKSTAPSNLGQQFQKLQIHQESQQRLQHTTAKSSSSSSSSSSSFNNFRTSSKLAVVRPKQQTSSSTLSRLQGTRGGKMDDNNLPKVESSNVVELLESGPVPDIEYPAGRTWKQQLEFDLKDEDDVASTSTLDHLLRDDDTDDDSDDDEETTGRRTMWNDWSESVWQNRQKKQQERDERAEKEVQDQINRLLEEEKVGLESLYDDTIDGFDNINNGHSHSYIFKGDMESNLLAIDDDDWSLPASSECGQLDQTNVEDLLFEL